MAGEGHFADMIIRMKNNQALKLQKKEHRKKLNELFQKDQHLESTPLRDVEISEEKLAKLKDLITRSLSRENRTGSLYTLFITFLATAAIVAIAYWSFIK